MAYADPVNEFLSLCADTKCEIGKLLAVAEKLEKKGIFHSSSKDYHHLMMLIEDAKNFLPLLEWNQRRHSGNMQRKRSHTAKTVQELSVDAHQRDSGVDVGVDIHCQIKRDSFKSVTVSVQAPSASIQEGAAQSMTVSPPLLSTAVQETGNEQTAVKFTDTDC